MHLPPALVRPLSFSPLNVGGTADLETPRTDNPKDVQEPRLVKRREWLRGEDEAAIAHVAWTRWERGILVSEDVSKHNLD